eukprot:10369146-Lingulodinium_polyedra.AAC.1
MEGAKGMMEVMAKRFVKEAKFRPLLVSYANDGTPLRAKHTMQVKSQSGSKSRSVPAKEALYCERGL